MSGTLTKTLKQMSDVAQGGATVFPQLNLSLWPKKGAAAFWYNLHSNGEGDRLTKHAACPVLAGSKWGVYKKKYFFFVFFIFLFFFNLTI